MASPTVRGVVAPVAGATTTSPAGTAIGDLVVIFTFERLTSNAAASTLTSVGGTYNQISNQLHNDGTTTDGSFACSWKIATVGGAQSYTAFTSSTGVPTWATGCVVLTAGTFDTASIVSSFVSQTTNAVPNPPALTLNSGRDWQVIAAAAWHLGSSLTTTPTAPTNYTNLQHIAGASLIELALATRGVTAAASEDPGTFGDDQAPNGTCAFTVGIANIIPTRGRISFAVAEVPFVATRGRVSFAEAEVPFIPTRGRISFTAAEVPLVPTRGRVSFTEAEVPYVPTRGRISFAEVEFPDLVSLDPTRGRISFTVMETPYVPTRGRISFTEFEAPIAPTRGRISFTAVEVPFVPTRSRISFTELEIPLIPTRGRLSFTVLETPLTPTRGRVSFAEVELPLTPTRARIGWAELQVAFVPTRGRISFAELDISELYLQVYYCANSGNSGNSGGGNIGFH